MEEEEEELQVLSSSNETKSNMREEGGGVANTSHTQQHTNEYLSHYHMNGLSLQREIFQCKNNKPLTVLDLKDSKSQQLPTAEVAQLIWALQLSSWLFQAGPEN